MASSLSWLITLKSAQLKTLCTAIGINSTGTKPTLIAALTHALPRSTFTQDEVLAFNPPSPSTSSSSEKKPKMRKARKDGEQKQAVYAHNILSIDMGIRNLAYCRLLLPPFPPNPTHHTKPLITEWKRLDISSLPLASTPSPNPPTPKSKPDLAKPPPPAIKKPPEPFHLPTYASHAHTLLTTLLAPTPLTSPSTPQTIPITTLLLETQRHRSTSSPSVQEWTLRVNMFEAMLYATAYVLKAEGSWAGSVSGVLPARVARFWVGDEGNGGEEGEGKKEKKESKSVKGKRLKIGVARRLLEERGVELGGDGKVMGEAFLGKVGGGRKSGGEVGKLDDLADCLLQGLAWVRWEENRRLVVREGVGALDVLAREAVG